MPADPARPGLAFAFRVRARVGRWRGAGAGPQGERWHIPILGGTVEGPRLRATILPGGSDWPVVDRDGNGIITARCSLEAEDGTLILVENDGLRIASPEVRARLAAGDPVDPSEYWFRTVARLDAPDGPHGWLRRRLFVGSGAPSPDEAVIDLYEIT